MPPVNDLVELRWVREMKTVVLETPDLVLWFHDDRRIVHHELRRYPGIAAMQAMLNQGLEVLEEHGANKWLSDNSNGGAFPKVHHDWALLDWGPRAAQRGWKYWALVPPKDLLGEQNMRRLKERMYSALGVRVQVFKDSDKALAWLAQCKP